MAILIVGRALLRVAKHLVGFAEFFEFVLSRFIPRIFIRVIFYGKFAVGLLDLFDRGALLDGQYLVVVALSHAWPRVAGRRRRWLGATGARGTCNLCEAAESLGLPAPRLFPSAKPLRADSGRTACRWHRSLPTPSQ